MEGVWRVRRGCMEGERGMHGVHLLAVYRSVGAHQFGDPQRFFRSQVDEFVPQTQLPPKS